MTDHPFAVIGAGNAGSTYAAHLKTLGRRVHLVDKSPAQLQPLLANDNRLRLNGQLECPEPVRVDLVSDDLSAALAGTEYIICTVPAHFHAELARELASVLVAGQKLLLSPGRTAGALEVQHVLAENGCAAGVVVVEAQSILYACRRTGTDVQVFGLKQRVPCAGPRTADLAGFFAGLQEVFPQFVPAEGGLWETSLSNIGMLFHPGPTLLNLGRMESPARFDYYTEGFSPSVAAVVEQLDRERLAVARAMGLELPGVVAWLTENYGARGPGLYEALQSTQAYQGIQAPRLDGIDGKRTLRYVVEDVPTGLVPTSELGRAFGVPTPGIDTVIQLAALMYDRDFRSEGRNLQRLGLDGATPQTILAL